MSSEALVVDPIQIARLMEAREIASGADGAKALATISKLDDRLADIAEALSGEQRAEVQALRVAMAKRCLRGVLR